MQRQPVTSSNVRSIGYADGTLEVEFLDGSVYQYMGVSERNAKEAMTSPSVGRSVRLIASHHKAIRLQPEPLPEPEPPEPPEPEPPPPVPAAARPTRRLTALVTPSLAALDVEAPPAMPHRLNAAGRGATLCQCGGQLEPISAGATSALFETGNSLGDSGIMRCNRCMTVEPGPSAVSALRRGRR